MTSAPVHVVGAGLSGLAAAVATVRAGCGVRVYEAAGQAGGRCRSFFDAALERRIDNGNHLILSGNKAATSYLRDIGADASLTGPDRAEFRFLDLASGDRWRIDMGPGRFPWWVFSARRRVPDTGALDYLRGMLLLRAGEADTVHQILGATASFRGFWEPLALAILNTAAEEGAARLLGAVLRETVVRGGGACRPLIARDGLGDSFVEPALAYLHRHGAGVDLGRRLRSITFDGDRVRALDFADGRVGVGADEIVVLAVPAWIAADMVPGLDGPNQHRAIVNGHFRLDAPVSSVSFLGLIGGLSQWLFVRGDVASVTVSAADAVVDRSADEIAREMWPEVARALGLAAEPLPPHRIVKERRATFAQTPEQVRRRPPARTRWRNLVLAGDWTDTGLPATIEGSIRSGNAASAVALQLRKGA